MNALMAASSGRREDPDQIQDMTASNSGKIASFGWIASLLSRLGKSVRF